VSSRLKIALAVSLTLNVFILGAAGGVLYTHAHARMKPGGRVGALSHAADDLNPADQIAFRRMLHEHVQAARPLLQDARRWRRDALDRLSTEPFDRAAAGAAMAKARDDEGKVRATLEDAILDFAAKLDPRERADMAADIRRGAPMRWGGPGRPPPISAGTAGPPDADGSPPGSARPD
jgi:uncharacterized membrane protein